MAISEETVEQRDFHEHYVEHQGKLYAYIASLIPRRDDAEELFSQCSLVLWKKWIQYDHSKPFMPWARAVAYNEIRNFLRRKSRQEILLGEDVLELLSQTQEKYEPLLEERREALEDCIRGLVDAESSLLERHYAEDESVKHIAKTMDVAPATIYMRMYRIRQFLHECVDQRLLGDDQDDSAER